MHNIHSVSFEVFDSGAVSIQRHNECGGMGPLVRDTKESGDINMMKLAPSLLPVTDSLCNVLSIITGMWNMTKAMLHLPQGLAGRRIVPRDTQDLHSNLNRRLGDGRLLEQKLTIPV